MVNPGLPQGIARRRGGQRGAGWPSRRWTGLKPLAGRPRAAGHRHQAEPCRRPAAASDGRPVPGASTDASRPWPVVLEGQQGLGQLLPVGSGGDNGQDHGAIHRPSRPGPALRRGMVRCQQADLPCAGAAERQILGAAADAVHRGKKRQQLEDGRAQLRSRKPRQSGMWTPAVWRRRHRDGGKVRVARPATAFRLFRMLPASRLIAFRQHSPQAAPCGNRAPVCGAVMRRLAGERRVHRALELR